MPLPSQPVPAPRCRGGAPQLELLFSRCMFGGLLLLLLIFAVTYDWSDFGWETDAVCTWMINYADGFVRRGLPGELIWGFCRSTGVPLPTVAFILYAISATTFAILFVRMFKRQGWSPALLPSFMLLGSTLLSGIYPMRDFWMMLLAWAIFLMLRRACASPSRSLTRADGAVALLIILQLFIHEAAFFFTFPAVMLVAISRLRRAPLRLAWTLFWPLAVMGLMCFAKGGPETAGAVWRSWMAIAPISGSGGPVAVRALSWTLDYAVNFHIQLNFLQNFAPGIPSFWFIIPAFIMAYYLVTRLNTASVGLWRERPFPGATAGAWMLIQWVGLLPLFTVLSCDPSRIYFYWVTSTLLITHVFGTEGLPRPLLRFTTRLDALIASCRPLRSPYLWWFIMIFIPVGVIGGVNYKNMLMVKMLQSIKAHAIFPLLH